ncbi:MAG: hypothetical protein H0W83_02865 [Planctomycetes bacterium]|nr:hypothetical protein [Planctomycetota bacterium]
MKHLRLPLCLSIGLVGAAGLAPAADSLNDLRVQGDYLWTRDHSKSDTTFRIGAFTATQSDSDTHAPETHFRTGILWMGSLDVLKPGDAGGSFIYGVGAAYDRSTDSDPNIEFISQGAIADLYGGWGWACSERCHIELTALGGGGVISTRLESTIPGITDQDTDTAPYYEYGVRAGTYYTSPDGWQFGIEGSYTMGHITAEFTLNQGTTSVMATGRDRLENAAVGVGIGYRFR